MDAMQGSPAQACPDHLIADPRSPELVGSNQVQLPPRNHAPPLPGSSILRMLDENPAYFVRPIEVFTGY